MKSRQHTRARNSGRFSKLDLCEPMHCSNVTFRINSYSLFIFFPVNVLLTHLFRHTLHNVPTFQLVSFCFFRRSN